MKVCIYGPEGIGKTTFASQFPNPVFIDTEGSTKFLDVMRFDPPRNWSELIQMVQYVRNTPGICQTLVLDTADWAEKLCLDAVTSSKGVKGIEDIPYGKGYVFAAEEFGKLLNLLTEVAQRGVNVVICAHAMMRKFEQPDEMGSYDRWELKLSKKIAPLVKEWVDLLLFANYKTTVVTNAQGKRKAQSSQRIMYTSHSACWDAKNRQGLPDEMPFQFSSIAHVIPGATPPPSVQVQLPPLPQGAPVPNVQHVQIPQPAPQVVQSPPAQAVQTETVIVPAQDTSAAQQWPDGTMSPEEIANDGNMAEVFELPDTTPIPEAWTKQDDAEFWKSQVPENAPPEIVQLYDLIKNSGLYPVELQTMVGMKGYFPEDMDPKQYPLEFISQCLIPNWQDIVAQINAQKGN